MDLAREGLKSPSSPWLLGCTEEMLIKVPYGEGNTRTLGAWVEGDRLETAPESAASSRFPHSLQGGGGPQDSPRGALRAGAGEGGGTRGREASPGCAPRGPEPQISHRSARSSRVRRGNGRAGGGPAQPAPGASAPRPLPPPPRAPGETLRDSPSGDPLVSSRAGQKLQAESCEQEIFH